MDEGKEAPAEDQLARDLAKETARRQRTTRWVMRGSIAIVVLGIAAWAIGWKLPTWLYQRADLRSRQCFAAIAKSGRGDPDGCVAHLWFHGLRGEDREAAASLEGATAYTAREVATEVAMWSTLDAAARDRALRARAAHLPADPGFEYTNLVHDASRAGAHEVVLELARAIPASMATEDLSGVMFDGLTAALTLGDLEAARALIAPRLAAGEAGWDEWIGCLLGLACNPVVTTDGAHARFTAAQDQLAKHAPLHDVLEALGPWDQGTYATRSPWTLVSSEDDPDPAAMVAFADELVRLIAPPAKGLADEDLTAALYAIWDLRVNASRIAEATGDHAAAQIAFRAADQIAADPRFATANLPLANTGGLAAAVLPTDEALGWLDRAGDAPTIRLDRALVLAAAGRDAEAITALGDLSPFAPCGRDAVRADPFSNDEVCDAMAWTKLALILRTKAPMPPAFETDESAHTRMGDLRQAIGLTVTGDPAAIPALRWEHHYELGMAPADGLAAPMVAYVLSRLATDGEDVEVLLASAATVYHERHHQAVMAAAADLRGDAASAKKWRARRAALDDALAQHPAARRVAYTF